MVEERLAVRLIRPYAKSAILQILVVRLEDNRIDVLTPTPGLNVTTQLTTRRPDSTFRQRAVLHSLPVDQGRSESPRSHVVQAFAAGIMIYADQSCWKY